MKRTLIKLFRLKHLDDVIYRAMESQKEVDQVQYRKQIAKTEELKDQQIMLLKQAYEAKIRMLEIELLEWEARERKLTDREYKSDMQIAVNYEIATEIIQEAKTISKNLGKFQGLYDRTKIIHEKKHKELENATS